MGTASSVSITMLGFLAPCLLLLAALAEGRPQEEWATYKAIYGKEYSGAEDLMRYQRWLQNKEVVDAHNNGDHSYRMALMEHSDWTEEEMAERRLGYIPAQYDTKMELDYFEGVTAPNSIDYRNSGQVTGEEPGTVWELLGLLCYWGNGGSLEKEDGTTHLHE